MNWFGWVCLFGGIAIVGIALHGWLLWRLWGKLRTLGRELSTVATQLGEISAQLGELGLNADEPDRSRPSDFDKAPERV